MLTAKNYTNGQPTFELNGNHLTWFFKNGKIKAEGLYINDIMDGEWKFYRETGQLWQIGNFRCGKKNGSWIRYDREDIIEYEEMFIDDKIVKKNKSGNK